MPPKSSTPSTSELFDAWGRKNRKLHDRACAECGNVFRPTDKDSKYCSRRCSWSNNGGHNKKAEVWWINNKGYVVGRIWQTDGTRINVKKHRIIMESIIGRKLIDGEVVHHKDGNKLNNDPDNLELMTHGEHSTLSNLLRKNRRHAKAEGVK